MKDLYDSMERENDLKDQLKFSEEEVKMMRRRLSDMDDENESLRLQLQRMSEKASKHKRREKEREKQLEEERREREALSAHLARAETDSVNVSSDVIVVVGAEGSEIMSGDEPIPVTQRKDSTDEDLMNVMQMRIQLEMLEQELMNSHKKLDEMDLENENLQEEVKFLQGRLTASESQVSGSRDPPPEGSGGAVESYWEVKVREMAAEADDLRWKLIEREREMERMTLTRHGREHHSGRKQTERLKKSRSLEATPTQRDGPPQVSIHSCDLDELRDLRRQLEHAQSETAQAKKEAEERVEQLQAELAELNARPVVPSVQTDDAALENIELREEVKRLEQTGRAHAQQVKSLTESLHRLSSSRDVIVAPTETVDTQGKPSPDIPGMPESRNPESYLSEGRDSGTRDLCSELQALRAENLELRRLTAAWGIPGATRAERRGAGEDGSNAARPGSSPPSSTACRTEARVGAWPASPAPVETADPCFDRALSLLSPSRLSQGGEFEEDGTSSPGLTDIGRRSETEQGQTDYATTGPLSDRSRDDITLTGPTSIFKLAEPDSGHSLAGQDTEEESGLKDPRFREDEGNKGGEAGEKEATCGGRERVDEEEEKEEPHIARKNLNTNTTMEEPETETASSECQAEREQSKPLSAPQEDSDDGSKSDREKESKGTVEGESERGGGTKRPLSILERYPGGKSQIVTSGSESRLELMEKVLDMDDEIGDLISEVQRKEGEMEDLRNQVERLTLELSDSRDECRRTELELLQELDMLQDKNSVMSNLLDIINERAEAAEEELERRLGSNPGASASPGRAGSNVSQVSALSDTSTGSDEVFVFQYAGGKEGALTRDWEAKLKGRIESLERLLAEERQKVSTAEKKLVLSGIGSVSPSMSDDVKLRLREKELLQAELVESQHHLQIATDQIKGLRERLGVLEDEYVRLKDDYGKLYEEVDASQRAGEKEAADTSDDASADAASDAPTSPDGEDKCSESSGDADLPFVSKRISVVEAPKFRELRRLQEEKDGSSEPSPDPVKETEENQEEKTEPSGLSSLAEELELYKMKAREWEFKVEEINAIWKSKSDASEKERDELQRRVSERNKSLIALEEKLIDLKKDITIKNKIIAEKDKSIAELKKVITDKEKLISETARSVEDKDRDLQERDSIILDRNTALAERAKQLVDKDRIISELKSKEGGLEAAYEEKRRQIAQDHTEQVENLDAMIAQKEGTIRTLDAAVRTRDERLREKDEILRTLNSTLEQHKREMTGLGEKLTRSAATMKEKDAAITVLRTQLPEASVLAHDGPSKDGGETDAEKEGYRLKAALQRAQVELKERAMEYSALQDKLEESHRALEDAMLMWDKDRSVYQGEINQLEEKVRLFEQYNPRGGREDAAVAGLRAELQVCLQDKEALAAELSSTRLKMEAEQRAHKGELGKLQSELTEKLKLLKSEVDNNSRVSVELDRLRRQNELGYRVQQELRVLKADTLALKVRYETRIDKMSKEHNKMLLTIDQLQKERDRDRETVLAIQKNLSLVKDKYTEELLKSEEDKGTLSRQRAELDESRGHLELMQRHLRELKEKSCDQDRVRSDLITRFSTERSSWEIERANLHSQINQVRGEEGLGLEIERANLHSQINQVRGEGELALEIERANLHSQINQLKENISCSSREEGRSKDIQVNMGLAWEKERGEQRRLLQEAHTLALDLQDQLKTREEASNHDRKELVRQLEAERETVAKTRRDWERRVAEVETSNRKLVALQSRLDELHTSVQKDREVWIQERAQLSRQLAEVSNAQARDVKRVEDVLSNLIRLRELGTMALPDGRPAVQDPDQQDKTCVVSQAVLDFAKEAVYQMSRAADELTAITSPSMLDRDAIKSISASEMDLVKQEFTQVRADPNRAEGAGTPVSAQSFQAGHVTPRSLTPLSVTPASRSPSGERAVDRKATTADSKTSAAPTTTSSRATLPSTTTVSTTTTSYVVSSTTTKPKASEISSSDVSETKKQKQKELTKEQQKQLQKELKKKKEEEELLQKKQKKKVKEGGGFGGLFGRHKGDKDSAKSSPSSPPPQATLTLNTTTANTVVTTTSTIATISTVTMATSATPSTSTSPSSFLLRPSPDIAPSLTSRPFDMKRPERPPSYASGTRSAQGSRATTPEVPDMSTWPKQAAGGNQYLAGSESYRNQSLTTGQPDGGAGRPRRPKTFSKSMSVDSAPTGMDMSPSRRFPPTQLCASFSPGSGDRQQWTASDLTSLFASLPTARPSPSPRIPVIALPTSSPAPNSVATSRAQSSSPHRDKLSPRTARRKFFDEYPTSPTTSPTSGQPSTPTLSPAAAYEDLRRSVSPSRLSVEEAEFAKTSHAHQHAQVPPPQMTSSASWDEKMHYRITHQELDYPPAPIASPPTASPGSGKPVEISAKEKRRFFKKSSSLDSSNVGVSIAQAGVSVAPVAAPSNFAPSDFFAAVKGKLKPVFKRKSAGAAKEKLSGAQPEVYPDGSFAGEQEDVTAHDPHARGDSVSLDEEQGDEERETVADLPPPKDRSRGGGRTDRGSNPPKGKWRSKSADRLTAPPGAPVHGDVVRPVSGTWKFNETAV